MSGDAVPDGESVQLSPSVEHDFRIYYEDERTYKEVASCINCGLEIDRPHDLYPILECPPVEMFTPEWYSLMEVMPNCDLQWALQVHSE